MKRDMELIRQILQSAEALEFEDGEPPERYRAKTVDEAYQIALMQDAGLELAGSPTTIAGGVPYEESIIRLTWAGHDFLDSTRDSNVWNKAKEQVLKSGASWTFDILKEWVKYELKQRLGFQIRSVLEEKPALLQSSGWRAAALRFAACAGGRAGVEPGRRRTNHQIS